MLLDCDGTCLACTGPGNTDCVSCQSTQYLSQGSCYCFPNTYWDPQTASCLPCDSTHCPSTGLTLKYVLSTGLYVSECPFQNYESNNICYCNHFALNNISFYSISQHAAHHVSCSPKAAQTNLVAPSAQTDTVSSTPPVSRTARVAIIYPLLSA